MFLKVSTKDGLEVFEFVPNGSDWALKDARTGLILPSSQNITSLAGPLLSVDLGETQGVMMSVGHAAQGFSARRVGPMSGDIVLTDEDGVEHSASKSSLSRIASLAVKEALREWLEKAPRAR